MNKKRFYFNAGDSDNRRVSLVRGFFYAMAHPVGTCPRCGYDGDNYRVNWSCATLEETSCCDMSAYDEVKAKGRAVGKVYTDPDNTEGKEAYIEFEVWGDGEDSLQRIFALCNEMLKLDEAVDQ